MREQQLAYQEAVCLRVYMHETDTWQGQPFYQALFALLQGQNISRVTVFRGIEGFGPAHHLASERLPDLSDTLPIIVEIVESPEKIAHLLPVLDRLVQHGTIVRAPVKIVL